MHTQRKHVGTQKRKGGLSGGLANVGSEKSAPASWPGRARQPIQSLPALPPAGALKVRTVMVVDTRERRDRRMKPGDVADILNASIKTVWKLIASGALPAENITPDGKRPTYRVRRESLDGFLARQATIPERVQQRKRRLADDASVIEFMK